MSKSNNGNNKCQNNTKTGTKSKSYAMRRNKNVPGSKQSEDNYSNTSNEPGWYATDPTLIRNAGTVNYSWSIGSPLSGFKWGSGPNELSAPSLAAIHTISSIGRTSNPSDPINVAANSIYSYVRHANSGHSNYDAPDLMLYLLAMSQVYSYIVFLQRAYGISQLYSQKNRYLPDVVLRAMSVDPEDIRNNQAQMRYGVNMLINKASSFAVPNNMTYFNREAFLYRDYYTEGTSLKDQIYAFTPEGFYKFTLDDSNAGMLQFTQFALDANPSKKVYTVTELLNYGNDLLNPLISSEDMNIMSGDIYKAYGEGIIKMTSLPDDYYLVPKFDAVVLEQIKNATVLPGVKSDITQTSVNLNPYLVWEHDVPSSWSKGYVEQLQGYRVLTTQVADPTCIDTIENTRLMPAVIGGTIYPGADYIYTIYMYYYVYNNGERTLVGFQHDGFRNMGFTNQTITVSQFMVYQSQLRLMNCFHYLPSIVIDASEGNTVTYATQIQLDNYAILSNNNLKQMHEACMLNLLHVDMIAKG